jgi:aminoglycoside phosphotransferase (APT) family kinase protein
VDPSEELCHRGRASAEVSSPAHEQQARKTMLRVLRALHAIEATPCASPLRVSTTVAIRQGPG